MIANTVETPRHACTDRLTCLSSLAAYSIAHFCVDLACAMLVMGLVVPAITDASATDAFFAVNIAIITYNFMAFVLQLPVGAIADRVDDNALVATWGCVVVVFAYMLSAVSPMLAAVVAGIGNAMFHVGGGLDTLNMSGTKRADLPGVFVSTGAMGLFLGLSWDKIGLALPELPIALLTVSGILIVAVRHLARQRGTRIPNEKPTPEFAKMPLPVALTLIGMFVTVMIRSYLGFSVAFPWKSGVEIGALNVLFIVLGKALGGIVGDRIGWKRTALISLPLASVLFLFSYDSMPVGLFAMLLFNMTMPLTLTVLVDTFRHNRGAAFGVTTVALFLGGWTTDSAFLASPAGIALMCLVSFATIMIGFHGYEKTLAEYEHTGKEWTRKGLPEQQVAEDTAAPQETKESEATQGQATDEPHEGKDITEDGKSETGVTQTEGENAS